MSSSVKPAKTYEVICGGCEGRLRVEQHSGAVVCPHCSATLTVPDAQDLLDELPRLAPNGQPETEEKQRSIFDSGVLRAAEAAPLSSIQVPSSIKGPDFSRWGAGSSVVSAPASANPTESSGEQTVQDAPQATPTPPETVEVGPPTTTMAIEPQEIAKPQTNSEKQAVTKSQATTRPPSAAKSRSSAKRQETGGVSRQAFLFTVIYASAVTAICLGLLFYVLTAPQRELESLPDVVPPRTDDGEISRILAPVDAPLPPGHVLHFGQAQRFGDLLVTPIKVTREPLAFVHYREEETREPAGEVLKLWLKLENVGNRGRRFAPLDGQLIFYRKQDAGGASLKANNFLSLAADRAPENLVSIYDHPVGSDWDLAGQKLGTVLGPGESFVTYVPTETNVPELAGPLSWRVHLRKGIADNGWGVTTLVEIAFDADAIRRS